MGASVNTPREALANLGATPELLELCASGKATVVEAITDLIRVLRERFPAGTIMEKLDEPGSRFVVDRHETTGTGKFGGGIEEKYMIEYARVFVKVVQRPFHPKTVETIKGWAFTMLMKMVAIGREASDPHMEDLAGKEAELHRRILDAIAQHATARGKSFDRGMPASQAKRVITKALRLTKLKLDATPEQLEAAADAYMNSL
jgi:hypothetical protein